MHTTTSAGDVDWLSVGGVGWQCVRLESLLLRTVRYLDTLPCRHRPTVLPASRVLSSQWAVEDGTL